MISLHFNFNSDTKHKAVLKQFISFRTRNKHTHKNTQRKINSEPKN